MHRVTIVGSGFAALTAIQQLRKSNPDVEITLVSPAAEFVYLPGLIWVPPGLRRGEDLRIDLTRFLQRMRVRHVAAEATGLSHCGRTLETTQAPINNDGLIIASGGRFLKKLPGIEHAITPCEGIAAAERIRERIRAMDGGTIALGFAGNPKEPSAMRGGPMFEFLFGLDNQLRQEGRRERFELVFFTPAPRPGNRLGPKAVEGLLAEMRRRDIRTHLGHKLKGFSEHGVSTEGGDFAADLILFMPGMTGNTWFDNTELPRSPGGLIEAERTCRVPGYDRVYVAGDSGSFPGPEWMPKQAHMADLQARTAARNLLAEFAGQTPTETFRVELLCIVDANRDGMLVARNERFNLVLPSLRVFHWLKRFFEWNYLRRFR
ncbi:MULTISPECIES: NAD(P)/FAD-dependent oxidoreductase [Marichromatium]|uniref:Sulfide:quinone oxidoreductase n=1 Tax=Marichromatium gracile TaxID=1048 RepID=A0A4R4AH58_MARGR|nr:MULTISPECIES: FAD-dependent oxidoreductase [Marichromatium]MBK1708235.1 pyridine nucleotide-disulfide oxidoreductase [Marichromatium gracile]MBO8087511.1 FAD-dependent oxidoreductase [Marichromatium sp.]RNE91132.1 NAD(P)/FAD-dependent oxidoreductase [Marichromatium sp. AB32]TCW38304.1 sulfide:quinone oxidoreductase [Marichromatium gracile]